jgi:sugar phosphate isomerase/epimerase
MDTSLRLAGKPEAVEQAAKLGFEGIQLSIGRPDASGRLPLSNLDMQGRYQAAAKRHNIAIAGTYLDVLHVNCLKNDEQAKQWVREGIVITRNLGCKVLMIVFFGKCELKERTELDAVAAALKELAPEAGKAGVVLGFENTISADDDIFVLDKVGSNALQVYYDVGNATNIGGFDASAEIRRLGAKRICQFHFKDKGYMGEGKVDFPAVMRAIAEIGFEGFANLETSTVSGSVEADLRRNLEFIRGIAV